MSRSSSGAVDSSTNSSHRWPGFTSEKEACSIGDRQQLAAVGRGGVLDLATAHADPTAHLTLSGAHRFTRADRAGRSVPDTEYADLTLAMRAGEHRGRVFDHLAARGQIRLHPDETALQASLAATAVASFNCNDRVAVVTDTREQTTALNAAIRDRLVADGRVDDTRVVTTRAGQRIGVGDRIATRRNDYLLGLANRDVWSVAAVDQHGGLYVTPADVPTSDVHRDVTSAGGSGRALPARYVTDCVELAYASTAHGVQGDTVTTAHVVIGEHTGAAATYVGMTRGRRSNTAHLIAENLGEAREEWTAVFTRDAADLGPAHAATLAVLEAARYAPYPSPAVRRPEPEDMRRLAPRTGASCGHDQSQPTRSRAGRLLSGHEQHAVRSAHPARGRGATPSSSGDAPVLAAPRLGPAQLPSRPPCALPP
jgi:ATP-dependent exoDNAse (exonuclease V) alpha subunit